MVNHEKNVKNVFSIKNYNLNVTEVLDSTFKKKFSRNFQFRRRDPSSEL